MARVRTKVRSVKHEVREPRTRYSINYRLLIVSVILLVVGGGGGYAWYRFQVSRSGSALLARAQELENDQDWRQAIKYVNRYVGLQRGTAEADDAIVRLAYLTEKSAEKSPAERAQAVRAFYRALGVASDEDKPELRSHLLKLLVDSGRFDEAEKEATPLLADNPNDPAALRAYALSLYAQVSQGALTGTREKEVFLGGQLEEALKANPGDVQLSLALARTFRENPKLLSPFQRQSYETSEKRHAKADAVLAELVRVSAANPEAWLARFRYRRTFDLPDSASDLEKALSVGPDNLEVRLVAASDALSRKTIDEQSKAAPHYEHILAHIDNKNAIAWLNLGQLHAARNEVDQALQVWTDGLKALGAEHWEINVQVAAALLAANRWDEADEQIKAVEKIAAKTVGARSMTSSNNVVRSRSDTSDLLRASWFVRRGESLGDGSLIQKAIPKLERLRNSASVRAEPMMLLGACYEVLRQFDAAAKAYDEVVKLDPKRASARAAAAGAWLSAGQPDESELRYEQLVAFSDKGEAWLGLAIARLQQQARRPPNQRNWSGFNAALAKAQAFADKSDLVDPWRIAFLKGDYTELAAQDLAGSAAGGAPAESAWSGSVLTILRDAEQAYPDSVALMQRLIPSFERLGDSAGADRALDRLEQLKAPEHVLKLLRARLLTNRKSYDEAESLLRSGLADERPRVRAEFQRDLIRVAQLQGKGDEAKKQLIALAKDTEVSVDTIYQLGEVFLNEGDFAQAEQQESRLRDLEGPSGTYWRVLQVRRLVAAAKDKQDANLVEAAKTIKAVVAARPKWSVGYRWQGIVADRQEDFPGAVAALGKAVELGDRSPQILQRLFMLLKDSPTEAERYLAMVGDPGSISADLAGAQISITARSGNQAEAVSLARAEIERRPQEAVAHFWLGRVLLNGYDPQSAQANEVRDEAQKALLKALELEPKNLQYWNGLFLFHVRVGAIDEARSMIGQIDNLGEALPAKRLAMKAQCYMALNDRDAARQALEKAVELEPNNADYHVLLANYFLRENLALANEHLRAALKINPKSDPVRRTLASVLLAQGGAEHWAEADKLLGAGNGAGDVDLRMKAEALLLRKGPENLKKAREILEKLKGSSTGTASDQLLLAQAYELSGMESQARAEFRALAARENATPNQIAAYADYLVRHEQWNDAAPWIKQLETKLPSGMVPLQLRARWMKGQGRSADVDGLLDQFVTQNEGSIKDKMARARFFSALGEIAADSGRNAAAEKHYRQAMEHNMAAFPGVALALARQNRAPEAVEVCRLASETIKTPQPVMVACDAVLVSASKADGLPALELLIEQAIRAYPDDTRLLGSVANLRFFQRRSEEALALYRKVAKLAPHDVVALNNLATALGEQPGQAEEALGFADEALRQGGQQPPLLDTKGTILLSIGRIDQAIPLLETAANAPNADPRFVFHLAIAYSKKDLTPKAKAALKRAKSLGLESQVLTDTDRQQLIELEAKLAGGNPS